MWAVLLLIVQTTNPHTSPEDVKAAREIYRLRCAECHGIEGEGGRGPNLADGDFYHGGTDRDLFRTIQDGILGTEMPGFSGSEERLWQLVALLRSLNRAADADELPGDPARGEKLFREKGDCLQCHRLGRDGGFAGPDLSSVGSRRSLPHLRASVLDPNREVRRRYWVATVTGPTGRRSRGFILNEDRHSLQFLDLGGKLRSLDKTKVERIHVDRNSIMQSYHGIFDEDEINDLLSYLASLRKARSR
ncbi:MAG: c-type cytochrome [Acidobacteriota bacterium]